jgi:hypothetical protein
MMDRIGKLLPALALTAAAALVVILSLKVRDMNDQYARLYERATQPYAGMFVPPSRPARWRGRR